MAFLGWLHPINPSPFPQYLHVPPQWQELLEQIYRAPVYETTVEAGAIEISTELSADFRADVSITDGTLSLSLDVLGGFSSEASVSGTVELITELSAQLTSDITVDDNTLTLTPVVRGAFTLETKQSTDRESLFERQGQRPFMPLIVYALSARSIGSTSDPDEETVASQTFKIPLTPDTNYPVGGGLQVPEGGSFLVASDYIPDPADGFAGAQANYIGTRFVDLQGNERLSFRKPRGGEVVWFIDLGVNVAGNTVTIDDGGESVYPRPQENHLYRWNGTAWRPYESVPERGFLGQLFSQDLDPDQIYPFYLRLMGATYAPTTFDTKDTLDLMDPETVPSRFIDSLAAQFNVSFRQTANPKDKRRRLRNFIATSKEKGLPSLVRKRLRDLGFDGFVNEIWINPTAPTNFEAIEDAPDSIFDADASPPTGDAVDRGIASDIRPETGQKGIDILDKPPGYPLPRKFFADPPGQPGTYVMSSRVSIHLNKPDGTPIYEQDMSAAEFDALRNDIARELMLDVLPVHVDIRYFVTGLPIGESGAEHVVVQDDFTHQTDQIGVSGCVEIGMMLNSEFTVDRILNPDPGSGVIHMDVVVFGDPRPEIDVGGPIEIAMDIGGDVGPDDNIDVDPIDGPTSPTGIDVVPQ